MTQNRSKTTLVPLDAARYLTDDAAVAEYVVAVLESGNTDLLLLALSDVARARGVPLTTRNDDAPEADAAWFAASRPAAEVLPGLVGDMVAQDMLKPRRGRPLSGQTKTHVNLRLDADILAAFKRDGAGWQTRLNMALRDWLALHPQR